MLLFQICDRGCLAAIRQSKDSGKDDSNGEIVRRAKRTVTKFKLNVKTSGAETIGSWLMSILAQPEFSSVLPACQQILSDSLTADANWTVFTTSPIFVL